MCVVSMIMDHTYDRWNRRFNHPVWPAVPYFPPVITQDELDNFRELFEKAKKYDRLNHEPDCEMAEKKKLLTDLAKKLGVDISFIDE